MAKKALTIVTKETPSQKTRETDPRVWRERALSEEDLFHGHDEAGRTGWFLRLTMTGMYPRRIGPYNSKEDAMGVHEAVMAELVLGSLTDIFNDLEGWQVCVLEGVPHLAATASGT